MIASIRVLCYFFLVFYISLAGSLEPDATISIPMRDGVSLHADIYYPPNRKDEKTPCVLVRSPGGRKADSAKGFLPLTQKGYTVVIQDARSASDAGAKSIPYVTDGWGSLQDGYDTVEWLAKSSYCNGKVGTAGISAMGITQLLMAPSSPPSLKCQYVMMAAANMYHDAIFPGGQFCKHQVEGWLRLFNKPPEVCQFLSQNSSYNEFWQSFDTNSAASKINAPGLHLGGWYDIFIQGTLDSFSSRQKEGGQGAKGKQKLIIGPWVHHWPPKPDEFGDFKLPTVALAPPIDLSPESWFDHHLKDINNHISSLPPVTYYVMGPFDGTPSSGNVWKHAESWPIPSTEMPLYLAPEQLLTRNVVPENSTATFSYNPDDPIPTMGGRNLFLPSGPRDQQAIERRSDVATFTSLPLEEDMEITGRVLAKLFLKTDAPTNIVVRITDVYPDGRRILIADGITFINNKLEEPTAVKVDLWSTSIVFAKGHRIGVSISGSNYPKFEKSPVPAKTELLIGKNKASHIILPLIKKQS